MAYQNERTIGDDAAAVILEEGLAFRHGKTISLGVFREETQERDRALGVWDDPLRQRDRW